MKLSKQALDAISKNTRIKNLLALALDCSGYTIERYISANNDNLTKVAAIRIIRNETGLTEEDILESEVAATPQK